MTIWKLCVTPALVEYILSFFSHFITCFILMVRTYIHCQKARDAFTHLLILYASSDKWFTYLHTGIIGPLFPIYYTSICLYVVIFMLFFIIYISKYTTAKIFTSERRNKMCLFFTILV